MKTKSYQPHQWVDQFPGAITVCDMAGTIVEMNERSKATFAKDGGGALVGKDVRDCHPPVARAMLDDMLASGEKNVYTIEKNGVWKLIYQAPWYLEGKRMGLVEISLEIPENMKHFKRS
jgi:transcriptional regulator with PAS, ATPase and Fis domain